MSCCESNVDMTFVQPPCLERAVGAKQECASCSWSGLRGNGFDSLDPLLGQGHTIIIGLDSATGKELLHISKHSCAKARGILEVWELLWLGWCHRWLLAQADPSWFISLESNQLWICTAGFWNQYWIWIWTFLHYQSDSPHNLRLPEVFKVHHHSFQSAVNPLFLHSSATVKETIPKVVLELQKILKWNLPLALAQNKEILCCCCPLWNSQEVEEDAIRAAGKTSLQEWSNSLNDKQPNDLDLTWI